VSARVRGVVTGRGSAMVMALAVILAGSGCRQDMHDQPKYQPHEASAFFADGRASRPLVDGTVARGHLDEDALFHTGRDAEGGFGEVFPFRVGHADVERGRERYDIYCSPCHDRVGNGNGMIVQRGFNAPTSLHEQRLRDAPPGYFFHVITEGFGVMQGYAAQVPPRDRWAIAAYIRALQLSQNTVLAEWPLETRAELAKGGAVAASTERGQAHD